MKSNSFFSIRRLYLLLRSDILINYKKYLYAGISIFLGVFLLLYIMIPTMNINSNLIPKIYGQAFSFMLIFFLGLNVSSSFQELGNKIKTTNYLLFPASTFEKYLSEFIMKFVIGLLVFLIIFWIDAQLVRLLILSFSKNPDIYSSFEPFSYSIFFNEASKISFGKDIFSSLAIIFLMFSTGIYLFSVRLFFKKFAAAKTLISLAGLVYVIITLMVVFSHIFYPETKGYGMELKIYLVTENFRNINLFFYTIGSFSWLFFLPLGYFKLKEKQI